jgi:preprotein translocase subunit SecG
MTGTRKQQIDKETWNKMSFYIDIIVFAIIAICIYLLIQHSYSAGLNSGTPLEAQEWFTIAGIVAFLAICLTWIFFRLYRYRGEIEKRY